ncbi:MAG: DUF3810 domain-containing protein [Candidatus Eremiobacteraeota bacterium]|nr:DUF3810 domain-containing protein [Candidatus Eremiobacteraeota bacterium]
MRLRAYPFEGAVIAAALALALVRPPAGWIERRYANGLYPQIDRAIRGATGPVPICVGDVLFVIAVVGLLAYWSFTLTHTRERLRHAGRAAVRTLAVFAFIFVWFEIGWALNYSRIPLAAKIVVHPRRTDAPAVNGFANHVVDELSREADAAHREHARLMRRDPHDDDAFVPLLKPTFEATIHRLGDVDPFSSVRVKPTMFQPFFAVSGTSGFTDPWTHEVNIDAGAFFFERPMYYAHEWAHIAGFTDESEANFISAIACTRSHDPLLAYSGWLLVWFNLPQDVVVTHPMRRLAYDDIMAVRARYFARINRNVEHASRDAYDHYLKSNHVAAGYASYGLFVRWMTGADFDSIGLPIVKPTPAAAIRGRRVR